MEIHPGHFVAIFGGAVAGAEAAGLLSRQGIYAAVFEQNPLPYGKIEDGLPKWHVKLRDKEEQKINEKLSHPYVFYVPNTKLGRDFDFKKLVAEWGFSAILLATGAWKDRPLPVDGAGAYVGRGLYYQNPFIYWFNHFHEPNFAGGAFDIPDGTVIVGGGLASIDVVKAVMMLTIGRALAAHGHPIDMLTLEKKSPAVVLQELGLTLADLGLKGCSLYYRRTARNMPLTPIPEDADARRVQKAYEVRQRMISKLQEEFLFTFHERHMPVDKITEGDRLAGLVFQRTEVEDGRVRPLPGAFVEVRAPLVISSIGSMPEMIDGVPARGGVFDITDPATGRISGYENVFALGNAVTGRGNIKESRRHGQQVSEHVLHHFLGWRQEVAQQQAQAKSEAAARQTERINAQIQARRPLDREQIATILERVRQRQAEVGYDGDFEAWRRKHLPQRLEDLTNSGA